MLPRRSTPLPVLVLVLLLAAALAPPVEAQGTHRFEVTWHPVDRELTFTGRLQQGETRNVTVEVRGENVTSVVGTLAWSETGDDLRVSGPDRFRLTGATPAGEALEGSPAVGDGGSLRVEARSVNDVPVPFDLEAEDAAAARRAAHRVAPDGGEGVWRFTVTLEGTANPEGTDVDQGNRYVLTVTVHGVEASVMRVVALEDPGQEPMAGGVAPAPPAGTWRWAAGGLAVAAASLALVLTRELGGTGRG